MKMDKPGVGEQELALLRFVTDHAPISVGEAAEQYGKAHGLARTTILTVMERLRKKGYLRREKTDGVYHYSPCVAKSALLRALVGDFTRRVLGGSVQPVMAYLSEDADLTPDDVAALKAMVQRLEEQQGRS